MIRQIVKARIGLEVTNFDDLDYRMFYFRGSKIDNSNFEWIKNELEFFDQNFLKMNYNKIPIGKSCRFWLTIKLTSHRDYFGDVITKCVILKSKKIK